MFPHLLQILLWFPEGFFNSVKTWTRSLLLCLENSVHNTSFMFLVSYRNTEGAAYEQHAEGSERREGAISYSYIENDYQKKGHATIPKGIVGRFKFTVT